MNVNQEYQSIWPIRVKQYQLHNYNYEFYNESGSTFRFVWVKIKKIKINDNWPNECNPI